MAEKEIFRTSLWVIVFLIIIVVFFIGIFRILDWQDIVTAKTNMANFVKDLNNAKKGQVDMLLQLPSIVERVEIVPAKTEDGKYTGKGKYCLSQTCAEGKCLDYPFYVYIKFSGKNDPQCIEEELCCNIQFSEQTLFGMSTSNSIGGKLAYVMQVSFDSDKNIFNAVVKEYTDKDWDEKVQDVRRSIFG